MHLMRAHQDIIRAAGHDAVVSATGRPITTVRSWDRRNSIPVDLWPVFIEQQWTSGDELLEARVAA